MSEVKGKRKIRRVDIVYWFLIVDLIVVIIAVLAWRARNASEIINAVSVGSGMASILLALVAIVYAFLQTESSSRQSTNLQNTLDHITQKVHELGVIKDELTSMKSELVSFRDLSTTQNENVLGLITKLQEQDSDNVEVMFEKLKEKAVEVPDEVRMEILEDHRKKMEDTITQVKHLIDERNTRPILNGIETAVYEFFQWHMPKGTKWNHVAVADFLRGEGIKVSHSHVLKILNRLVEVGLINKIVVDGRAIFYTD